MTPVSCFRGREVALFGLGGSGLVTARALAAGGAHPVCWDDSEASRVKAASEGLSVEDLRHAEWSRFAALVLAPGVPLTHPKPHWSVEKARAAAIEVIGDIELFCRERAAVAPEAPFIAITGTNGKSTTTALVAHLARHAGWDAQMGGNIGRAVLSLAPPAPNRVHVVECSSFQIDTTPTLRPSVGILLNITPDHLDRHGTMERYAAIKERLVAHADVAVVGVDDAWSLAIAQRLAAAGRRVVPVSVLRPLEDGIFAEGTRLMRATKGARTVLADLGGLGALRGAHNAQNAAAAIAAIEALGAPLATIRAGLATFPGLAHRMEPVAHVGPVLFVNDSKATNADAAQKALEAFPGGIFWIIGGIAKEGGIAPLAPLFTRVERAFLIGEASDAFAATLEDRVPYERCAGMAQAVTAAAIAAASSAAAEPVVLLSPACSSFDHYPNFEARGSHFRDLVRALPGAAAIAGD